MGGLAVEDFGAFHQRLGEGRVRVDAEGKVLRGRAHLDGQHAFGDEFARAVADDAHAQHALSSGVNDELRETVRAVKGQRAAARAPRELRDGDFDAFGLRLGFGQAARSDVCGIDEKLHGSPARVNPDAVELSLKKARVLQMNEPPD